MRLASPAILALALALVPCPWPTRSRSWRRGCGKPR
jgi:hypothetical protein